MPCVYKIVRSSDDVVLYVGSTKDINCRELNHLKTSVSEKATMRKVYELIRNNGGWENHKFVCCEDTDKEGTDLLWLERKYYDELKPIGNVRKPICTEEEREKNELAKRAMFYRRWKENN